MKSINTYLRSNGKVLITGEYLVLEGATALALPIKLGQSLKITKTSGTGEMIWLAEHIKGHWFKTKFSLPELIIIDTDNNALSEKLQEILKQVKNINSFFLTSDENLKIETNLEFLPQHGLGSSSTLINNIANWAGIDAFNLQQLCFGGSGYDIACARNDNPLFFTLKNNKPLVKEVKFNPSFSDKIYFVYLGKKQISTESIKSFRSEAKYSNQDIEETSKISMDLATSNSLNHFDDLVEKHESKMSRILGKQTVKQLLFNDHLGSVKSLGGWGGDFVMMTSNLKEEEFANYLSKKGLNTFYRFKDVLI